MRKPHGKSVLKLLPPERQKDLHAYLGRHTLEEAEAWLATQGVDTGRTALSEFFAWYPLFAPLQQAASMGDAVKEILRELPGLNLDEQQLSKAGQAIFEAQALQEQDSELYLAVRKLRQTDRSLDLQAESGRTKARQGDAKIAQKEKEIALSNRRVKLLEENQRQAKEKLTAVLTHSKGGLTPETLKQIEEAAGLL